jgi:hypothetical protein
VFTNGLADVFWVAALNPEGFEDHAKEADPVFGVNRKASLVADQLVELRPETGKP